jgi:CMP/dCMP kinase
MNVARDGINRMHAVTISRAYGSAGDEIAAHTASRLGWQLLDHALVERVAHTLGTSEEEAAAHDEHSEGVLARLLKSLQYIDPVLTAYAPPEAVLSDEAFGEAVNGMIRAIAAQGQVVIVGRGAPVVLAGRQDVLRVRIIAPFEQRVTRVMRREGVDQHTAVSRIRKKEHDRTRYLESVCHCRPDEAHQYDLVVNTALLDVESAVQIICFTLRQQARRLVVQTHEQSLTGVLSRSPVGWKTFVQAYSESSVLSYLVTYARRLKG